MTRATWPPDVFEALFQAHSDPWNFESSAYEQQKLARMIACLPPFRARFAVEMGCAVGIGTRALAERCDHLLAVDASATALAAAQRQCAGVRNVRFLEAFLPRDYPSSQMVGCDLIIISELLYFLGREDVRRLAVNIMDSVAQEGTILLVNWTGDTDTPCTGDQAAECFIQTCHEYCWTPDHTEHADSYRIDRLRHVESQV